MTALTNYVLFIGKKKCQTSLSNFLLSLKSTTSVELDLREIKKESHFNFDQKKSSGQNKNDV